MSALSNSQPNFPFASARSSAHGADHRSGKNTGVRQLDHISQSEEILGSLRFISKVTPGEKINVSDLEAYPYTLWFRFSRWKTGTETKEGTHAFVKSTFEKALELAEQNLGADDELTFNVAKLLITEISSAKSGVNALIQTYTPIKRSYVSTLEVMLEMIDLKLEILVTMMNTKEALREQQRRNPVVAPVVQNT